MSTIDNLVQQILAQNTTSKWTGEGYGGAEANAKAMAKLLADAGITDIKQFGKVDKYEPVTEIGKLYNGNRVYQTGADEYGNNEGSYYYRAPTEETDSEGNVVYRNIIVPKDAKLDNLYGVLDSNGEGYNPIDSSKVVIRDGVPTTVTGQTWGNKATGQAINRGAGRWERQGGDDLFSGTGEGSGNTAFRAQISPDGTPIFYTTKGSSSDVASIMPFVQLALAATGAGGLLGNALLGAGASQVAAGALGNAILGGATSSLAGGDWKKGALLGGAGGALSGYLQGGPIDASNMTPAQFNDALESQLIGEMQRSGLTNAQITQFLENASPADITSITSALPVTGASDNLLINAAKTPITATDLISTLSQVPTVVTTAKTPEQVSPDVLSGVTSILSGGNVTTPTVEVTDKNVNKTEDSVITPITTTPITTTTDTTKTTETKAPFKLTPSDVIRVLQIGSTVAAINAAKNAGNGGPTQYDVVPVPTDWTSPKSIAATWNYPKPVDFGTSDLLKGTQWEKYLSQTSTPNRLNEMNYNELLTALKNNKPVSIDDVITGIQSQYAPPSTGQLSAQKQGLTKSQYIGNITDWLNANPNATDAQVRAQMAAFGISQQDVSQALNKPIDLIQQTYDAAFTSATPEQKADAYNSLIKQGLTDAQIRSAINADAGVQTDTDWNYLQQLAATTNPAFTIAQPTLTALQSSSPTEKASAYNTLVDQGYNDAQIRGTINNLMGTQSDTDWSALQQYAKAPTLSSLITQISSGTPQQKAATYNQLLGQGYSDADIYGAANTLLGPQSQADWTALQSLAKA